MRARSSLIPPPSSLSRGFTLIEVLVVIAIIVLVLALAVPALNVISGTRSIEGAENNVSAMLGRARQDAMALQRPTGVMFFIDDASRGVMMAEVYDTQEPSNRQVALNLVADRDFFALPRGVSAQVIDNTVMSGTVRNDDGYIGYNPYPVGSANPNLRYGGVIMFDAGGRLYNPTYCFDFESSAGSRTRIADLFGEPTSDVFEPPPATGALVPAAGYGLVLFDREAFIGGSGAGDEDAANADAQVTGATYATRERGEENWIDDNSVPLLINRYNGTLVRGE